MVNLIGLESYDDPAAQVVGVGRRPRVWHGVVTRRHGMASSAMAWWAALWRCATLEGGTLFAAWYEPATVVCLATGLAGARSGP